jgi:hypothetical protein
MLDPLTLISDNTEDFFYGTLGVDYDVDYDGVAGTLTVTGKLQSSFTGGNLQFFLQDDYGNPKTITYYNLPAIIPPELSTSTGYHQEGSTSDFFLMNAVAGATNYRFWVTTPLDDDPETHVTPPDPPNYSYPAHVPGLNVLNVEISTYDSDSLFAEYPFGVVASSSSAPACYNIPDPGLFEQAPPTSSIIRGDNTYFCWTVNDLTDCLGDDLTLYSHNLSDILYNESTPTYSAGTLDFCGRVRSSIGGGTMRFTFTDDYGQTKILNYYPPSIIEPSISIIDPHVTLSEGFDIELLMEPSGVSYYYTFTRPNDSAFNSTTLTTSSHTVDPSFLTMTGIYNIDLAMTAGDLNTFHVLSSVEVHEDPEE